MPKDSALRLLTLDPASAARETLDRLYGHAVQVPAHQRSRLPLAGFQADAAARILGLLVRRGGALLADSTGLGKTHVAMAVIEQRIAAGNGPALIVTPATLRPQWVLPLRRLARALDCRLALPGPAGAGCPPTLAWTSHTRLSRGEDTPCRPQLVVVDEAHAFRNPRTRRYRELARVCHGAQVLLVTATPVNNSLSDLYFLLRLFLGNGDLADLGIPDLRELLQPGRGGSSATLRAAIAALTVRRTRRVAESTDSRGLRFPRRDPPIPVLYDLESLWGARGLAELIGAIEGIRAEVYGLGSHHPRRRASVQLLRFSLLKRLESSAWALGRSVGRLGGIMRECETAVRSGRLPSVKDFRLHDPDQLRLGELLQPRLPPDVDRDRIADSLRADTARIRRIHEILRSAPGDPKADALRALLAGPLARRPVLLFTEFRDTALYLHGTLLPRRVGLVTGREALLGGSPVPRRRVIEAFAPLANGADIEPHARVDVLVATDVLSEGMNLQDCADVVSYDLPWNPVRLVQRIGRVDRLGSLHGRVRIYNFLPDRGLDAILGLLERLREKLDAIRSAAGLEASPLGQDEFPAGDLPSVLRRLRRSDSNMLSDLEIDAERGGGPEERVQAIVRRADARRPAEPSIPPPPGMRATPGPIAAELPLPAGAAGGWLVVATERGMPRFVFVRGGRVREDRLAALALLADAAAATARRGPGAAPWDAAAAEAALAAATRHLASQRAAPPPHPGPSAQLARELLRLLRQVPGGASAAECGRVDAILGRLRPGLSRGTELAVEAVLAERRQSGVGACGIGEFMERIESLLACLPARPVANPQLEGPAPVSIFRLVPAAELVLAPPPGG